MDIIIKELYMIKEQPVIYIGQKSCTLLKTYIDGYTDREREQNPNFTTTFNNFSDFIATSYKMETNKNWERVLTAYSWNDEEAFDLFYKYLDKFIELGTASL